MLCRSNPCRIPLAQFRPMPPGIAENLNLWSFFPQTAEPSILRPHFCWPRHKRKDSSRCQRLKRAEYKNSAAARRPFPTCVPLLFFLRPLTCFKLIIPYTSCNINIILLVFKHSASFFFLICQNSTAFTPHLIFQKLTLWILWSLSLSMFLCYAWFYPLKCIFFPIRSSPLFIFSLRCPLYVAISIFAKTRLGINCFSSLRPRRFTPINALFYSFSAIQPHFFTIVYPIDALQNFV